MSIKSEDVPVAVPEKTKQTGETRPTKWDWVERSVWTERMLEALEKGVRGGIWFSLIDKVYRLSTLELAWSSNIAIRPLFVAVGGWIRRRLRSILRMRAYRKGISRGFDHIRWPNKYFRDLGLFSLEETHRALLRPS